ncbi:hypothetical protein [Halalkalicoccus salilacus]|uniref:hypothetical protein n=1 Tax=Halalkalicoccus salilacus TaxID=3117459 RepID=UPI00300E8F7F
MWVALISLVTLAPLVLLGTYSLYYLYGWLSNVPGTDEDGASTDAAVETLIDRLRHRYATARSTRRPSNGSSTACSKPRRCSVETDRAENAICSRRGTVD